MMMTTLVIQSFPKTDLEYSVQGQQSLLELGQ